MTYRELADELGISLRAAEARAKRHVRNGSWRRRTDNEPPNVVQVLVPSADLEAMRSRTVGSTGPRTVGGTARSTDPHDALVAELRRQAETERQGRETAEAQVRELRERVGRLKGELAGLHEAMRRADLAIEREAEGRRATEAERDAALAVAARRDAEVRALEKAQAALEARLEASLGARALKAWRGVLARWRRP